MTLSVLLFIRGDDRLQFRLPRQSRKGRIDQSARNQEKMSESFLHESVQNEVGTYCHRASLSSLCYGVLD
jgi:hypothetical protein